MAQEPSLSELYSYRPNAELAQGDRNVVPDDAVAIQALTQGAREGANLAWNKYVMFQKNLAENMKEAKFDYKGIRPQDKEYLMKKAANFYSVIAKDPSILGNPAKNPAAYAEMMQAQQGLQSEIAKSVSANEYTTQQMDYQAKNPELRNSFNDNVIKKANETPLEQWSAFQLKPPTAIDFVALSGAANKASMQEEMIDEPIMEYKRDAAGKPIQLKENGKPKFDAQGNPVFEQYYTAKRRTGIVKTPSQELYTKYGDALWDSNEKVDKYGTKIQEAVSETFELLPENQKEDIKAAAKAKGEKDPLKFFYKTTWGKYYTPTKDLSGVKAEDDKFFQEQNKFKNDVYLKLLDGKQDRETEAFKASLGQQDKKNQAKALLQYTVATVEDGFKNGEQRRVQLPDGRTYDVIEMNVSPQAINLFGAGTVVTTKDGETTEKSKEAPDKLFFNKKNNTFEVAFYKRKEDGTIDKDENGGFVWDKQKSKTLSEDQFVATLGKDILSKDKLPEAYQYFKEMTKGKNIQDFIKSGEMKSVNTPSTNTGGSKTETISGKTTKSNNVDLNTLRSKYKY